MKPKVGKTPSSKTQFWPGTQALQEIQKFQKSTELLIPKALFLQAGEGNLTEGAWGPSHSSWSGTGAP